MRPIRLRLHGFGPFRDEVDVNFDDLDLFALVGSTGSGKSTVIDGMTFALFGRIARLDAKAVAPVINAMSNEARVLLDFEVGGTEYTAARVVRRTKTGASTKEIRLESAGEVLADGKAVDTAVEELLGLNYDRFTRVVVLPQGKFAEFLHDKPAERQGLLRRMLNLGIYERMGQRARQVKSTATSQLEVLRPRLEKAGVTEAQIAALDAEAAAMRTLQTEVGAHLATRAELDDKKRRVETEAHDFGVLAFACANVAVPDEVAILGTELDAAVAKLDACKAAEVEAQTALESAKVALEEGPDGPAAKRMLEDLDQAKQLEGQLTESTKELADAAEAQKESQATVAAHDERTAELEAARVAAEGAVTHSRTAAEQGPSEAAISQARAAHESAAASADRLSALQAQTEDQQKALTDAEQQFEVASKNLDAARDRVREIERDSHVEVLVGALAIGDECPVCLQTVGELPAHEPSGKLEAAVAEEKAARTQLESERAKEADAKWAQTTLLARIESAQAELDKAVEHAATHPPLAELDSLSAKAAELSATVGAAEKECDDIVGAIAAFRESVEVAEARTAHEAARTRLVKAETSKASLDERLVELKAKVADAPPPAELEAAIKQAAALAVSETAAAKLVTERRNDRAVADEAVAGTRKRETEWRARFDTERNRFVAIESIPAVGHESLYADWVAFADWAKDQVEPLKTHAADAAQETERVSVDLATADKALGELVAEHETLAAVEVAGLSDALVSVVAQAEAAAKSAQVAFEQYAEDRKTVATLEEDEQVYGLLGNLLRSDGFEQWLLDEVVEVLVERASERLFELSSGQYSIEADAMDFMVRDHRNGDELRDARTLSGGETFLASLSLALALADSIQEMAPDGAPPIESLFLDEGFGTLDPETLDVVAAAIEELGASGRMVGVITHIRDLAERMPVRFEVTKQATTSVIEKVDA